MKSPIKNNFGFTLLEIMIAVTIMAFISIFTARMIQQGVQAKTKIQSEIDRTSGLKSALALMTQDLQLSFNYRDVNAELFNAAQKARQGSGAGAGGGGDPSKNLGPTGFAPANPQGAPDERFKLKEDKTYTRFFGEHDKLNFTSLNNFRPVKNLQESDQIEVGYYIENCSSRLDKSKSSDCLWRRTSPYLDEDVTEGGKATAILENVKSLKFRYLGIGHEEEWVERWHTEQGEEVMKNHFPNAVEITLTINDKRTDPPKEIAMTAVASLRFPNNRPTDNPNGATTNAPPPATKH